MHSDVPRNATPNEQGSSLWPLVALLVLAAVVLVALQFRPRRASVAEFIGRPLPPLDAAGWLNTDRPLSREDLRGKVVLVDFWATWCGPCFKELPDLMTLKDRYRDQGLVVIGLTDEANDRGEVKQYVESQKGIDWPIGYGAGFAFVQMGIEVIPTFVVFDRQGRAVWGGNEVLKADETIAALLRPE